MTTPSTRHATVDLSIEDRAQREAAAVSRKGGHRSGAVTSGALRARSRLDHSGVVPAVPPHALPGGPQVRAGHPLAVQLKRVWQP